VPVSLVNAEQAFSAQLRTSKTEERIYSRGMSLYRKIVRENISSVLQSVFPLFCRCLDDAGIRDLTDAFLHQHQADQPEFHQVATELLLFIRQQPEISSNDLALVEYEWLIYAVEIDDSDVPLFPKFKPQLQQINNIEVKPNPTLKIISLPFWIKEGLPYYEGIPSLHYYALYRKNNNVLYQKKLKMADMQLLLEMNSQDVAARILKDKAAPDLPVMLFTMWLGTNSNDEILSLILKE
jgi:hypothetical protein